MDFERLLNQKSEDDYWYIENEISSYLMRNNEKYKNNSHYVSDIMNDYKNLEMVLEDHIPVDLTKEEVSKLIEYINKYSEKNIIEKQQIYYAGCRFAYFFIKEMGLLKETNIDLSNAQQG